MNSALRFLSQSEAIALDAELMNDHYAYTNVQLMELAGLACADAIRDAYPVASRVLVLVGPGNNGGDALVAARHLHLYGVQITLHFPRDTPSNDDHLRRLRRQCDAMGIAHAAQLPASPEQWAAAQFDVIVDGLFGFSFKSANGVRAPFDATIAAVNAAAPVPVVALDIPSGWDVDNGNVSGQGIRCDVLISLTSPKVCARHFVGGRHYLGGRFVPHALAQQHSLGLPVFPGTQQFVLIK